MKYTYEEMAKMIDHSLLHPTMTDRDLEEGCRVAARYGVASVCIKPYAARRAVELLQGSDVLVGCVIGFPHGNGTTACKRFETEQACRDGAVEIDMVINIGKALSGDWEYVEQDIRASDFRITTPRSNQGHSFANLQHRFCVFARRKQWNSLSRFRLRA